MAHLVPLAAGLLMLAGAQASDTADYEKFLAHRLNRKHGGVPDALSHHNGPAEHGLATVFDKEEEQAAQNLFAKDSSMPIGLSAIGVSLLTLAAMLGVRMRRGMQQATTFASSESDMSIALATRGQEDGYASRRDNFKSHGWLQHASQNSRPLTLCYATESDTAEAKDDEAPAPADADAAPAEEAPAPAPIPAELRWCSTMDFSDVKTLPGILAPTGFFDPAGLSQGVSVSELKRYREAELTHGRVAMLASLGFIVGESGATPLFGGTIDGIAINQFWQVPLGFWPVVLLFIAVPETFRALRGWMEPTKKENYFQLRPEYIPGDLDFDPLGLKPQDPEEFKEMQTKELQHCRLAMLAAAGMIVQELQTGSTLF